MPRNGREPSVVILEPFGDGARGHHCTAINEIIRRIYPVRPVVAVSAKWKGQPLLHDVPTLKLFEERPFRGLQRMWTKSRLHMHALSNTVLQLTAPNAFAPTKPAQWPELSIVCERTRMRGADHVILPTAEPDLTSELLGFAAKWSNHDRPRVHARFLSKAYRRGVLDLDGFLQRVAHGYGDGRLYLYVEMPAMQRYIEARHGLRADLFPYLLTVPSGDRPQRKSEDPLVFGYLGGVREHKGFERLLPIIQTVCGDRSYDRSRVRFLVQLDGARSQAKEWISQLKAGVASLDVDIRFHEGTAEDEQYRKLFESVDCLMMPYRAKQYALSGSGLLQEALAHGKPFVCSAGLSFSDYARAGNAIEAEDDAAFASAILRIARDPGPFIEAARASAGIYATALKDNNLIQRVLQGVE